MRKMLFCFSIVFLSGCDLFPESIGKAARQPKHDYDIFGAYIAEAGNSFHIFTRYGCDSALPETMPYMDTLTVDETLYHRVFFVKIVPEQLYKNYKNLDMETCSHRKIYAKGDSLRKQVPGFGERKFLVMTNVTGVL